MLKKYLACKHIIYNEKNEEKLKLKRAKITKSDAIRFEKGNVHEREYFELLKKKYSKIKNIKNLKNVNKFQETLKAMKSGYEVIYGGWLESGKWAGEFDFLEINKNLKSTLGNYSYEVIDTKNSSKIKSDHIYQTGVYCDLLKEAQGVLPENFYILLKNKKKEKVKLNEINEVFKSHKISYEKFLKNGVKETKPEKCSFCSLCDWENECAKEWKGKRHLNQINGMNKKNIKRFYNSKIKTIDHLAKIDPEIKIVGLRDEVKKKRIAQAKLQLEYEKTGELKFEYIKENLNLRRGFNILPQPSKCDLFFDLESVPDYVIENKLEYLFGIYYEENGVYPGSLGVLVSDYLAEIPNDPYTTLQSKSSHVEELVDWFYAFDSENNQVTFYPYSHTDLVLAW